jgi:hypothetical protein
MYAFIAEFPGEGRTWRGEKLTPEGALAWKPIEWVCDEANTEVVDSIPLFLPSMLQPGEPMEYQCQYAGRKLMGVHMRLLTDMNQFVS